MPGGQFSDFQPAIAPSLRSMYEIFGFDHSEPTASTAGFGFIPDGSMDIPTGNTLRNNNSVAFMMTYNGDLPGDTHAAVGKQVTLNGEPLSISDAALLDDLLDLADAQAIGLIAKGIFAGQPSGFTYVPAQSAYISDLDTLPRSHAALTAAASNNAPLTFTAVPLGSEFRMGVDRNNDGIADTQSNSILGTSGDDVLEGTDEDDTIIGNGGSDVFRLSAGDDVLTGNENAYDEISAPGFSAEYAFSRDSDGTITVTSASTGTDTLTEIDGAWFRRERAWYSLETLLASSGNVTEGTSGDDILNGTSGNDTLIGNGGSDVFRLTAGNDTIIGNAGSYDEISAPGSSSDYTISDNGDGTFTISSPATGSDTFSEVDGLWFRGEFAWYRVSALAN